MIIQREIQKHLANLATQFPAVAIMGPRQSGKTTLAKETFPHYAYVTLEDIDRKLAAKDDPRGFLSSFAHHQGVILDEVQEVPELFSYMQGIIDQSYKPGFFILTGSQNFLLHEKITQTLAGRIALLTLLPLSMSELSTANLLPTRYDALLIKGFYPRLYSQPIEVQTWFPNYISTYVEKDVRHVLQISDVIAFQRFLKLCAARIGNLVNYAELGRDCDISAVTAKAWMSVLETSFIVKLLTPYHKNYNKRVTKSPKLYFYDPAIACALLGIKTAEELSINPIRGALFESMIISEIFKYNFNNNIPPQIYFWRDVQGHEIDCIIEKSFDHALPIEVKSGMTMRDDFFKELANWKKISGQPEAESNVVYGGTDTLTLKHGNIVGWQSIGYLLKKIYAR